ncbi:hypothetical protein INR49_010948 [Caranx melampygus]|nr:hypothetical protein INR49_010948 [Caranx melampygus]
MAIDYTVKISVRQMGGPRQKQLRHGLVRINSSQPLSIFVAHAACSQLFMFSLTAADRALLIRYMSPSTPGGCYSGGRCFLRCLK